MGDLSRERVEAWRLASQERELEMVQIDSPKKRLRSQSRRNGDVQAQEPHALNQRSPRNTGTATASSVDSCRSTALDPRSGAPLRSRTGSVHAEDPSAPAHRGRRSAGVLSGDSPPRLRSAVLDRTGSLTLRELGALRGQKKPWPQAEHLSPLDKQKQQQQEFLNRRAVMYQGVVPRKPRPNKSLPTSNCKYSAQPLLYRKDPEVPPPRQRPAIQGTNLGESPRAFSRCSSAASAHSMFTRTASSEMTHRFSSLLALSTVTSTT